jgi:intracellular multiplication protein IcmO
LATNYDGGGVGEYTESRSAEVREVAGVDGRDLQSLIEGEAIILFGGRRIHAKLFHADIDSGGPMQAIEGRAAVRGPAEEEVVRAIQALTGDMVSAAREAAAAEAREATSPRLVGATP